MSDAGMAVFLAPYLTRPSVLREWRCAQNSDEPIQRIHRDVRPHSQIIFREVAAVHPTRPKPEALSACDVPEVRRNERDRVVANAHVLRSQAIDAWARLVDLHFFSTDHVSENALQAGVCNYGSKHFGRAIRQDTQLILRQLTQCRVHLRKSIEVQIR